MAFRGFFSKRVRTETDTPEITVRFTAEGVVYSLAGTPPEDWLSRPFAFSSVNALGSRLNQLHLDGIGRLEAENWLLPWEQLYDVLGNEPQAQELEALRLPPMRAYRPVLASQGSLGDSSFRVVIQEWVDEQGLPLRPSPEMTGGMAQVQGQVHLLPRAQWQLLRELRAFHAAGEHQRTRLFNERAWGQLRKWATGAHAPMSDYLIHTVVVTPDKLRLDYRRTRVGGDDVVEVVPDFDGAPLGWLERFDSLPLQTSYDVAQGPSLTRVVLSEPVHKVLQEIKRMPGRRATGARAEALVANPMSALGEAAAEVLDPGQIEQALVDAGLTTYRFDPRCDRDEHGLIRAVLLHISSIDSTNATALEPLRFDAVDALDAFCRRLESRLRAGHQWCGWDEFDFELLPQTREHLQTLKAWAAEWRNADLWRPEDLFDLSHYSSRIAAIGVEKPYALPFVQKRAVELDWFVDNVLYGLMVRPPGGEQASLVKVEAKDILELREAVETARREGRQSVQLPGAAGPIPLDDAVAAVDALEGAHQDIEQRKPPRSIEPQVAEGKAEQAERKSLVIKSNIDAVDHEEERASLRSVPTSVDPRLPRSLLPATKLKPHQLRGVAWLQHLWRHSPHACRGALLADDMGLGKTLQLLTFIAGCLEEDPSLPPVLVIAPVALLENWKAEARRFFAAEALPILTLYGSALSALRTPREQISRELAQHGITKLLRKDWVGSSRVVLTTYETLRDLEFTLAAQPWSIMVCDEAQKIKNPSAMLTRAAKKQNVRFRIACTGTPVENSLLDLWCLFDFIQPGLLGALTQFQRTYKQPIEAKTEEQKARVEELRRLIEPQTLRRTKAEVARDTLPAKLEDDACRSLPMSPRQLELYWTALDQLKKKRDTDRSATLQALQHIRRICSDPHWQDPHRALAAPLSQLAADSPKLGWMLQQLKMLQSRSEGRTPGEKVIVFCEFRDLQVLLQRAIREQFGYDAFVVNGDTSASLEVENSRQKLIDRFQEAPGFGVIILSPLAVGFGVNIQAANHVIHFTRTWNPAKEDQATDRAYRIGQSRDVRVYYPSVVSREFESFDIVLHKLLTWKRGLAADMLNAAGELSIDDFEGLSLG